MRIIMSAIGKRVQLIKNLKKTFTIIGVDYSNFIPTSYFTDSFYQVPLCTDDHYINSLLQICAKEKIDIFIPLLENEFNILDECRDKFKQIGTLLMLSNKEVLSICNDKSNTYNFFIRNNIDTPQPYGNIKNYDNIFPMFIKPSQGMGSKHSYKVNNKRELDFYVDLINDPIIQEYIEGTEYTMDCICDLEGKPISVVPRERIEVRAGEVTKSRTVKDHDLIDATIDVCNKLGGIGPLTIQAIKKQNGEIKFIEINPRFGGGVPLSIEAGVNYGGILKDLAIGKKVKPIIGEFKELTMLRYDEAVFI